MGNCVSRGEGGVPKNPSWVPHPTAETFFVSDCIEHMPTDTHMVKGLPCSMSMDSCDWDPRPAEGISLVVTGKGETKPLFRVQMAETKSTPAPAPGGDQTDEKEVNELPAACVTDAAGKEVAWLRKVKDGLKPHKLGNVMVGSSFQILQRSPDSPGVDNAFVRAIVTRYPLISTPDIGVSVFDVDGKYTHSGQWFTVKDKSGAGVTAGSKVPERAAANAVAHRSRSWPACSGCPLGPRGEPSPCARRRLPTLADVTAFHHLGVMMFGKTENNKFNIQCAEGGDAAFAVCVLIAQRVLQDDATPTYAEVIGVYIPE